MKKVLVDSSVWVSLFARDANYSMARDTIDALFKSNSLIILPTVVAVEVFCSLNGLSVSKNIINNAKIFLFRNKGIHICHTTETFWLNDIVTLSEKTRLKSLDLVILAHALKFGAELITFDKKLNAAYKEIN
jgi:predicted nucleic acid-binding protein